jgi:hypothetical protein
VQRPVQQGLVLRLLSLLHLELRRFLGLVQEALRIRLNRHSNRSRQLSILNSLGLRQLPFLPLDLLPACSPLHGQRQIRLLTRILRLQLRQLPFRQRRAPGPLSASPAASQAPGHLVLSLGIPSLQRGLPFLLVVRPPLQILLPGKLPQPRD